MPDIAGDLRARHPDLFSSHAAARRYARNIVFPRHRGWTYQLNGKSGNTTTLHLLWRIEFGRDFRVRFDQSDNHHPDLAIFEACNAGVWRNAGDSGISLDEFETIAPDLRIATVRNPYSRALSGFRYLCRSQVVGDRRFLRERIRLAAFADFDWVKEPDTPAGFLKFLRYVAIGVRKGAMEEVDAHWMPQAWAIRPEVYRPALIGRTEAMSEFARALAERLGKPWTDDLEPGRENATAPSVPLEAAYADPEARRLARRIYECDFDLFEYPRELPCSGCRRRRA